MYSSIKSTSRRDLQEFVDHWASHCQAESVCWIDGSVKQRHEIEEMLIKSKVLIPLNEDFHGPHSFLVRSDPRDVARVESKTFIAAKDPKKVGPINNYAEPVQAKKELTEDLRGSMKGRVMYVLPYLLGTELNENAKAGVQLTDSPYVCLNYFVLYNTGSKALEAIEAGRDYLRSVHSVLCPISKPEDDIRWPCQPEKLRLVHFIEEDFVIAVGSSYGGNAIMAKKAHSLRMCIAQAVASGHQWSAQHCLLLGLRNKHTNETKFVIGAAPSACGKTALALIDVNNTDADIAKDYEVFSIGDDLVQLYRGEDNSMRAIVSEKGCFGVAPGTSYEEGTSGYDMFRTKGNVIYTNVAFNPENRTVWWEGATEEVPKKLIDWTGEEWTPGCGRVSAHANSRFTCPMENVPTFNSEMWNDPHGCEVSAILFGGRRPHTMPTVLESRSWEEGVFRGFSVSSQRTAAAEGKVGEVVHDPFACRPFASVNMATFCEHWLAFDGKLFDKQHEPKIFNINWFRVDENNKFLWPGYGANIVILDWILRRCEQSARGVETEVGVVPEISDLKVHGLNISHNTLEKMFEVNHEEWKQEKQEIKSYMHGLENHERGLKFPEYFERMVI